MPISVARGLLRSAMGRPSVARHICNHLRLRLHTQELLCCRVVVQRTLGHARLAENCIDISTAEARQVNFVESGA